MKQFLMSCAGFAALTLASCAPPADAPSEDTNAAPAAETSAVETAAAPAAGPRYGNFGMDVAGMDANVHPGNDFNRYANGTWLVETELPSDRSRYGTFSILAEEAEEHVQAIINDAMAEGGAPGSNPQLVGALYSSWMNADAIEAVGISGLQPFLAEIAAIQSHDDAAALFASVHHQSPFGIGIWADPDDPSRNVMRLFQGGLGMGNRDYYLDDSERFAEYRQAYLAYITQIHELAGLPGGSEAAQAILDFETQLAEVHWTREDSRDVTLTYNPMSPAELDELAPNLNMSQGMANMGINVDRLIVVQPTAITGTSELFAGTDIETIKAWMTFHFISDRASWLPAAFDEASFDFFGRTLRGQEEQRPRDRRGVNLVGGALGHAVGQIYVDRHFPPTSKDLMDDLVQRLTVAFRGRLENLEWMDDETRAEALTKLSTFEPRIGFPEIWDEYDGLVLEDDDYFGNRIRMAEKGWADQLEDLYSEVDPREWSWPPQIVNASYNPLQNQITFPAGILQAPFFDPNADPAMNFGAIGGVIGHEIGHGFDDNGRRYDAEGRLRMWWTDATNERFMERASMLGAQYDTYCPIDDQCVSGRLSMGENIGDLGGLQMAYTAWREYVDEVYGGEAPVIDGFTGDQRFFLAWAQVWRNLYTDDALRGQLVRGPHSPPRYRINGVVRNLDAWYDAFGITEEHELYLPPDQRVRIW